MTNSRSHFQWTAKSVAFVLLGLLIAACGTRSADFTLPHSPSHGKTVGRHLAVPKAPACAPSAGAAPSSINMTMSTTDYSFSQSCYYAPANQSFTINFTNDLFAVDDHTPVSLVLYISPSSASVFQGDPNNPGVAYGNSHNAEFVSGTITAPTTVALSIPALPAGTYDIQTDIRPLDVIATLTVG